MHLIFPFSKLYSKVAEKKCQNKAEDLNDSQVKMQIAELKEFGMLLII